MDTHKSGKTFPFLWRICRIGISLFNFNRSTELCDLPTSTKFQRGRLNGSDKDSNFDNSLTTCFVILSLSSLVFKNLISIILIIYSSKILHFNARRIIIFHNLIIKQEDSSSNDLKLYHHAENINFSLKTKFYHVWTNRWFINSKI